MASKHTWKRDRASGTTVFGAHAFLFFNASNQNSCMRGGAPRGRQIESAAGVLGHRGERRHRPSTAVPGAIAAAPISATKALGPAWPSSLSRRLQWKHLAGFCRGPAKETGARPQPGTSVFTHRNGLKQRSAHGGCFMSLEAEDIGRRFRHQPMSS